MKLCLQDITNIDTEGDTWKAVSSHVRLIHVNTSQAIRMTNKLLGEWGFYQHEVATDRILQQDDTVWNVEEHQYAKGK